MAYGEDQEAVCGQCAFMTDCKFNWTTHLNCNKHRGIRQPRRQYMCHWCNYRTLDNSNSHKHCRTRKSWQWCRLALTQQIVIGVGTTARHSPPPAVTDRSQRGKRFAPSITVKSKRVLCALSFFSQSCSYFWKIVLFDE